MKTLQQEAEEYAKQFDYAGDSSPQIDFIEGANSNYVKIQILNAKIEGLMLANDNASGIMYRIEELEKQIKELTK